MRDLFPVYHRPTDDEFSKMWQEGVFTFDANVLLNIYRYTPETRERFFEVLHRLKDRIWVSHQAAHEYHKHRLDEISSQFKVFDDIEKHLNASLNELEINHRRHPFGIDVNPLTKIIKNAIKRAKPVLQEVQSKHHNLLASDPFRETIAELFDGKVGEPYSKEDLDKIHKKAEERFKQDNPPGYKDKTKGGTEQYGDVVLWFQLLDQAKSRNKPIIFITDDGKEDWWLKHKGKTISPRPELIQEMFSEAGVSFHMYPSDQFIKFAQNFLDLQDKQAAAAVEEVKEIRQQEEAYQSLSQAALEKIRHFYEPGDLGDLLRFAASTQGVMRSLSNTVGTADLLSSVASAREAMRGLSNIVGTADLLSSVASAREAMRGLSNIVSTADLLGGIPAAPKPLPGFEKEVQEQRLNQEEEKDELGDDEADHPSNQKTGSNDEGEENKPADE